MTGKNTTQTFTTETGEQTMVSVPTGHNVTVAIESGASDDIDIEMEVNGSTTRFKVEQGLNGDVVKQLTAPISKVGIDIDGNVSNDIMVHFNTIHP